MRGKEEDVRVEKMKASINPATVNIPPTIAHASVSRCAKAFFDSVYVTSIELIS